jgi:hypothetical protein
MERPTGRDHRYRRDRDRARDRNGRDRRAWLVIAILIPLSGLAIAGLVVALGVAYNVTAEEEEMSADERALMLDINHVSGWLESYTPDMTREVYRKVRYFDDSYEIEYEYDVPELEDEPYLSYSVTFETTQSDATTTYVSYWNGTKVAFYFLGDVTIEVDERNELFGWGDESRLGVLTADGVPFGNVFVAKRDDTVVYFLVSGIYFEESQSLSELLGPYLQRLEAHLDVGV